MICLRVSEWSAVAWMDSAGSFVLWCSFVYSSGIWMKDLLSLVVNVRTSGWLVPLVVVVGLLMQY